MSKLTTQPSFNTLDQAFYLATGEHLPSRRGDACPHPLEWYILKAQQRQQRERAYTILLPLLSSGNTRPVQVKPGTVHGIHYCMARLGYENQIELFDGISFDKSVLTLWPDGHEEEEATPAGTPVRFTLRGVPAHARSRAVSPIPEHPQEEITGIVEAAAAACTCRLRKGFLQMLEKMSIESLEAEAEGWREEVARAQEHLDAVAAALATRR